MLAATKSNASPPRHSIENLNKVVAAEYGNMAAHLGNTEEPALRNISALNSAHKSQTLDYAPKDGHVRKSSHGFKAAGGLTA